LSTACLLLSSASHAEKEKRLDACLCNWLWNFYHCSLGKELHRNPKPRVLPTEKASLLAPRCNFEESVHLSLKYETHTNCEFVGPLRRGGESISAALSAGCMSENNSKNLCFREEFVARRNLPAFLLRRRQAFFPFLTDRRAQF
jgi:hypothetical protein